MLPRKVYITHSPGPVLSYRLFGKVVMAVGCVSPAKEALKRRWSSTPTLLAHPRGEHLAITRRENLSVSCGDRTTWHTDCSSMKTCAGHFPILNKHCHRRKIRREHALHQHKLKCIKGIAKGNSSLRFPGASTLPTSCEMNHLQSNWKKISQMRTRFEAIQVENHLLLKKMNKIMIHGDPQLDDKNQFIKYKHSLNVESRRRLYRKIGKQNQALMHRLLASAPIIKKSEQEDDFFKQCQYAFNINESKQPIGMAQLTSRPQTSPPKPKLNITTAARTIPARLTPPKRAVDNKFNARPEV